MMKDKLIKTGRKASFYRWRKFTIGLAFVAIIGGGMTIVINEAAKATLAKTEVEPVAAVTSPVETEVHIGADLTYVTH